MLICVCSRGQNEEETKGGRERKQLKVKTTERVSDKRQTSEGENDR